ncbi:serine/threonine protein kinase [Herbiconiux sp. CPCC 205763]|uniref:non-specific serine/threonine protein kinase n=1 Tax=Herbiconiux aconitum TaxID=2970913 RepID=A0ABT2GMZ5_9MICO|nr:serine/threonine-protein kinase [Herbiconiux aconitum]MCS5717596.1 serine/threonine protein kinase [Herbiconiux aconitum]
MDGRYLLDARIGAGGMAVVYRARDEILGRTVAVKLFRDSAADPADAGRKTSETTLLAALNHHSLVTLFDARVDSDDATYLVMEYVDGPTLRERIAEGPIAPRDVAAMTHDLAEALHVVHQAGIVHRDIKPSNVLLRPSDVPGVPGREFRAKLADFGIAYLVDSTRLTTPGTLIGTAAYLSPEQVRGAEPAPASDIYAFGLVLIEALTGERAFPQTGTHEAALARLTRDPVIPGTIGYPWRSLLTAMTSRDPDQRPTALDVVLAAPGLDRVEAIPDATGRLPDTAVITAADTETTADTSAETADTEATADTSVDTTAETEAITAADAGLGSPADTGPTKVMPHPTDAAGAPESESPAAPVARPSRRRRWPIIVAVIAVIVVAVIVGVLIWALGQSGAGAAPALPPLDSPLDSHMRQLLESVTP